MGTHDQIAYLSKINVGLSNIAFQAVQMHDSLDWAVRIGVVLLLPDLTEEDAKKLATELNSCLELGTRKMIDSNLSAIKIKIEEIARKEQ